jgi:hypothetical protein
MLDIAKLKLNSASLVELGHGLSLAIFILEILDILGEIKGIRF